MPDLDKYHFHYIPMEKDKLFDLSCEYMISQLERIGDEFNYLVEVCSELTAQFTKPTEQTDWILIKKCFSSVDKVIDTYVKLVRCSKLSLGESIGRVVSNHTIFKNIRYNPNVHLQSVIAQKIRNTQEHFEERLQDHFLEMAPFSILQNKGVNIHWKINFGNCGYHFTNTILNNVEEKFDINNLTYQSYIEDTKTKILSDETIILQDIWKDIQEIVTLIDENIKDQINVHGICCPPIRGLSITMRPHN